MQTTMKAMYSTFNGLTRVAVRHIGGAVADDTVHCGAPGPLVLVATTSAQPTDADRTDTGSTTDRSHRCGECASTHGLTHLSHQRRICVGCRRRRHYHPETCPRCEVVRPLAWLCGDVVVCASCAGVASIFACQDCGREDHPYGLHRCARCFLRERLTDLLTDPATGQIHQRLRPVFDELVNSERPQTGLWWLRKKPGVGPQLLKQMACGAVDISHDTFRTLPSDRSHDYLRSLPSNPVRPTDFGTHQEMTTHA